MPSRTYINPQTGEIHEDINPRQFDEVLMELGERSTVSELSENFWDLIQRV